MTGRRWPGRGPWFGHVRCDSSLHTGLTDVTPYMRTNRLRRGLPCYIHLPGASNVAPPSGKLAPQAGADGRADRKLLCGKRPRSVREPAMPEAVVVATARSPIGRAFKGTMTSIRPDDLVSQMIRAALAKIPQLDPAGIEDLMLGCGLPGGEQGYNMARVVAVMLGYDSLPGTTITRYCSSSLQTTRMAFHAIKAGKGDGDGWHDPRRDGAIPDVYLAMGQTAENVAKMLGITRAEQDEFGVRSQNLAEKALADGFWQRDITPVTLPDGSVVSADDGPRAGTTLEKVAALKPVFRPDGTVTAGNCCPLNDGAAAVVIMSDRKAAELGITPLARIVSTGVTALSPEIMGLGPVQASRRALERAGMSIEDIDLVEINEAFAAQVIPSYRDIGIDIDKLNVNGGAIAVGHPFGMTGARITSTLLNSLQFHDKTFGLETMCVGGGQGMAMIFERLS